MTPPKRNIALATLLLLLPLAALVPGASAVLVSRSEGFEDQAAGFAPCSQTQPLICNEYIYTTSGTNNLVSTSQASTGTKSLFAKAVTAGAHVTFDLAPSGADLCGSSLKFDLYVDTYPTGSMVFFLDQEGGGGGAQSDSLRFIIQSNGAMTLTTTNSVNSAASQTVPGTFPLDAWHTVYLGGTCTTANMFVAIPSLNINQNVDHTGTITSPLDAFSFTTDTATFTGSHYTDNLEWSFNQAAQGQDSWRFCADPSLAAGEDDAVDDFGFEYTEDWVYEEDLASADPDLDLADGFTARLPDGDSAYFGKGFTTGSAILRSHVRIEAGSEFGGSVFRIAYTTGAGGLPSAATKGDGTTGGNFNNHVQVRFRENENAFSADSWTISMHYNTGAGFEPLGGSISVGNVHTPQSYVFTANSGPARTDGTFGTVPADTAVLYNGQGEAILTRDLPAGLTSATWKDVWYIGTAHTALSARTVLDDPDDGQTDDSTCIFDPSETAVVSGSSGRENPSALIIPGAIDPPIGLSAVVIDAQVSPSDSATIHLRWLLSPDDPNQVEGNFTYHVFVNGQNVTQDALTVHDPPGERFHVLTLSSPSQASGDDFLFQVRAINGTLRSALSCSVEVNSGVLGDTDACGDVTGILPPTSGGNSTVQHTTAVDTASGLKGFCDGLYGDSVASRFLCGLIFVVAVGVIVWASMVAFSRRGPALLVLPVTAGAGVAIFCVLANIWSILVLILMVVAAALTITAALQTAFFGRGPSA